ncbi:MAG: Trm112 family protein [Longimicrobiales bacterium]
MVDQSLLDILVCPETKQPLRVADVALLERLNATARQGGLTNRGGKAVATPVAAGLVRQDGAVLYPVRDDIPIMLIDESIPLSTKQ